MIAFLKGAAPAALLAASGVVGGCPAQQSERPSDLPPENVTSQSCPARNCLVIEPDAQYCSIDPQTIREGALFATKSTLRFAGGAYGLRDGRSGRLPAGDAHGAGPVPVRGPVLSPVLASANGEVAISPQNGFAYAIRRDDIVSDLGPWVEIEAGYRDETVDIEKFFLRTSRWPHDQFHLGDPGDTRWFFKAARNLFVQVRDGGRMFPGLSGAHIPFAPCQMDGLDEQVFVFEFANGDALTLTTRVINGSNLVGYYFGRLVSAQGTYRGNALDIADRNDLAFFGSTRSWAEMTIPGLAVRTQRSGDVCGIILDPSEWDSDRAVNGYVAYEMTCEERRGRRLPLADVRYPAHFSLP